MKLLAALLGILLLYSLQAFLYERYWKKNLIIEILFSKDRVNEGESLYLTETILNRKLLPLPIIMVKFKTTQFFDFSDKSNSNISDFYYRNDMLSVLMYQKITRQLPFICTKRGYYTIDQIDVICHNLFLTQEMVTLLPCDSSLLVYPRPITTPPFTILFHKIHGEVLSKRLIQEDPFEFRSIRQYQSFDTMKSINWKVSAKTGDLKVNVFNHTSSRQIKLLLNLELPTIWKFDTLLEESIRLVSSFSDSFMQQGIPTGLYSNGLDCLNKEPVAVPPGCGQHHNRTIKESLARIDTNLHPDPFSYLCQETLYNDTGNDFYIIISTYQKDDLLKLLINMNKMHKDFYCIVPLHPDMELEADSLHLRNIKKWEVPYEY